MLDYIKYNTINIVFIAIFGANNITMKLNRIKIVLVEKGFSQKWLAEQLGKSFSTTNAYCCNRQQPNLETLYKISQLLSVEMKDLIVEDIKRN